MIVVQGNIPHRDDYDFLLMIIDVNSDFIIFHSHIFIFTLYHIL